MKKIAKLSLVAAVAVAGLTNVNAASLEEAIKGVDVSGQFRLRVQDRKTDKAANDYKNETDVELEIGVKVPVTDTVTAVFKIDSNPNKSDSDKSKDEFKIEDYYFSYAQDALTVNVGQQNIPGRMTDGAQGDGIVALYNLGAVTLGAASFMNQSITTSNDVNSVIAMANVGPVSLLGQYADVADVTKAYNLKADASIEMLKVGVEYTSQELDGGAATADDRDTLKAHVSAKAGIVSGKVLYAATGDNGSGSIDGEAEAASEYLLWQVGTAGKKDMELFGFDASAKVTDKVSLRVAYVDGDYMDGTKKDISETLGQVSYKVAKNLNTYVRYSVKEDNNVDTNRGRVEIKYSF